MKLYLWQLLFLVVVLGVFVGCSEEGLPQEEQKPTPQTLFSLLSPSESGIDFSNDITEDYTTNIISYDYLYNGGGVGLIDIDNDGLEDIYFTGNQVPDRLYRNLGGLKFEDVTESSGLSASIGWSSGVAVADVNADGWMDIYVSKSGPSSDPVQRTNELFINQGDNTFLEQASEWGVDYQGHTTQALFFDMDRDRDLDMYLLTHPAEFAKSHSPAEMQALINSGKLESDQLFRNDGDRFTNVSAQAGIKDIAYGLGIACDDLNDDGWLDLYVSNDYDEGDILYVNNGDGTFTNKITSMLRHTANYGMGCDIGDINNDGQPDIMSVDMAFETHKRAKMNMASMDLPRFQARVQLGWHYQYMANMLHLNLGEGRYTEIAQVAGVHKTDWSWSCLFADFDLDGWQDILVTNGYKRDTKDNDLQLRIDELQRQKGGAVTIEEALSVIPSTKLKNYWYSNNGDLTFERKLEEWGVDQAVNSNGAVYGDLDNDGDLDVVLNNMDEVAYVYENTLNPENSTRILLSPSTESIGAAVITPGGESISLNPQRGFQSSCTHMLFVPDQDQTEFELVVQWPDGKEEAFAISSGKQNDITKGHGSVSSATDVIPKQPEFERLTSAEPGWRHRENPYNDYASQVLLPHSLAHLGPFCAQGKLMPDAQPSLFVGGGSGQPGQLFMMVGDQLREARIPALEADAAYEDSRSAFADLDGDGLQDLIVASGGHEYADTLAYALRIYWNKDGQLMRTSPQLSVYQSIQGLEVVDVDSDGDLDLVVGERSRHGIYPIAGKLSLLLNDGGVFSNVTSENFPALSNVGCITDIESGDFNGDGFVDLIVASEWGSPQLLLGTGSGKFANGSDWFPSGNNGWWYAFEVRDINSDGYPDILAGNLGENNKFHPSPEKPLHVYSGDLDNNGTSDCVLAKYDGELLLPVRGRECSSEQLPFIMEKFPTYESFAVSDLGQIYSQEALESAELFKAESFASGVFINLAGSFEFEPFSKEAQLSPINDFVFGNIDGDKESEIMAAGNHYQVEVETTRYDGGSGVVIQQYSTGMGPELPASTGFYAPLDAKDMEWVYWKGVGQCLVVVNNSGPIQIFKVRGTK